MFKIICIFSLLAILLTAGCTSPISQNTTIPSTPVTIEQTPALPPVFPRNPIDLQGKVQVHGPLGSFEESYIGQIMYCTNEAETYGTRYDFISGSSGPSRVRFQLVPVISEWDLNETPMPKEILDTVITPDDFIAQPGHLYTIWVAVTVGPNATNEHINYYGGGVDWNNVYYAFRLRAFVDGVLAPEANDALVVFKECSPTPGGPPGDGGSHPGSYLSLDENGIMMLPGEERDVNLTLRNRDGGIRELSLKVDGLTLPSFFENMTVSFDPPVTVAHNFWDDHVTMHVTTRPQMPAGEYSIPLRLCLRSLDPSNPNGTHFPFTEAAWCPSADFSVRIKDS
jgi:hypothetical protein